MYMIVRQLAISLLSLLEFAMLVRALMSWIPSLRGTQLDTILYQVTEPFIAPVRRLLWNIPSLRTLPIDLSFLITWLLISFVMSII